VRNLTPSQAIEAKRTFDELFNVVKVKMSPGMRSGDAQKVGEREAYVVEQMADSKIERYYFDTQTGLLLRKITINQTQRLVCITAVRTKFAIRSEIIE
jgi:hypothetical protein